MTVQNISPQKLVVYRVYLKNFYVVYHVHRKKLQDGGVLVQSTVFVVLDGI